MTLPRRRFLHLAAGATALPTVSRFARAQAAYPLRPITIVVPFVAAGALDVLGRILAERMRAPLGQTIIARRRPGCSRSTRWLHARHRLLGHARRERRCLRASLRRAGRF
jgi:hypothetical protein